MKKKVLSVLLTTIMAVSLLAGCGGGTSTSGTDVTTGSDTSGSSDGKTSLTYWSMWNSTENQAKVIQEAADAYEAKTGIHINIEWKGRDVKTLIGAALDAGEKIDIFDDDYMRMCQLDTKYLTDLTDMAKAADYEKHIMPIILDSAKSWTDGKLYVMPYQPYTTGVWYNKDMFEKAGITEVPTTWDEFLTVCQKLKDSGVNAITCNSDTATLLYGFQLARYIGQDAVLDCFNNADWANVPEAKKAAEDIQTLFKEGYMSEYAPAQYPDGQNEIGFGESCMVLNASWIPNEILQTTKTEVDFGFFPWPSVEGGVDGAEASMVGAQSFGIVDKSEHKQEAFDFLLTVVTGEYDLKMAESVKSIPADTENTEWPAAIAEAEPYFKATTKKYDWAVGLETNDKYKEILSDNFIQLCKQEITPDEFIKNMANAK